MQKIDALDEEIGAKRKEILSLRNNWLKGKGWEVTGPEDGFWDSFFYQKNGKIFMCEHEAIDYELHG